MRYFTVPYHRLFVQFIFTLLLSIGVAQLSGAQELPDYLDHSRYEQVYKEAKSFSDRERASTDRLKDQWRADVRRKQIAEDSITSNGEKISDNSEEIQYLNQQIINLNLGIERLQSSIIDLESQKEVNQSRIDDLRSQLEALEREEHDLRERLSLVSHKLDNQQSLVNSLEREVSQRNREVNDVHQEVRDITNQMERKKIEKANTEDRIYVIQSNALPQARREEKVVQGDLYTYRKEARELSEQIDDMERTTIPDLEHHLREAQSRVDQAGSELNSVSRDFEAAKRAIREVSENLEGATQRHLNLQDQLRELGNQRETIIGQIEQKRDRKSKMRQQIDSLISSGKDLRSEVRHITSQWEAKKDEVKRLREGGVDTEEKRKRLGQLRQEVRDLRRKKTEKEKELQQTENRVASLRDRESTLADEIGSLEGQQINIGSQIEETERNVLQEASYVRELEFTLQSARDRKNRLENSFNRLSAQLREARVERNFYRDGLNHAITSLDSMRTRRREVVEFRNNAKNKLDRVRQEIAQLESEIQNLRRQNVQLSQDLDHLRGEQLHAEGRLQGLRYQLEEADRQLADASWRRDEIQSEKADIGLLLTRHMDKIGERKGEMDDLSRQNFEIGSQIDGQREQIENHRVQIAYGESAIQSLEGAILELETSIVELREQIQGIKEDIVRSRSQFEAQDQVAQKAESVTSAKLARYNEVKEAFDTIFNQAVAEGHSQGQTQGEQDGSNQGVVDGSSVGQQQGALIGTEEGLVFGYNKGLERGEQQGQVDGYKSGFEAPAHRQEGVDRGWAQGLKDAQTEAQRVDYPKGRKDERSRLMSQLPSNEVTLDNLEEWEGPDVFSATRDLKGHLVTVDSPEAARRPMNVIHNSELTITANGEESPMAYHHLVSRAGVCTATPNVDVPEFVVPDLSRCDFQYTVFNQACKSHFGLAYFQFYEENYQKAHVEAVIPNCEEAQTVAFEENKNVKYQEGYDARYPIAFATSEAEGAEEARKKGFVDGKQRGFEENISEQRQIFYKNGRKDESRYFDESAVVTLELASLRKVNPGHSDIIVAGDELVLDMKVANFGMGNSARGAVKVQVEALTAGLLVPSQGWVDITSLPGSSLIHVINILKLKVDNDSTEDRVAELKVTLRNNEGDLRNFVVEVLITAHVLVDIKGNRWDLTPRVDDSPASLRVKVINKSQINAVNDLQLSWSLEEQTAEWLYFYTSNPVSIKASVEKPLAPNGSKFITISYRIFNRHHVRGKKIPIHFKVMSGGNISGEKTITITPR